LVDVFVNTVGIHMGINCAPLLADLFRYLYEVNFIQGLLKKKEKKLVPFSNFTFRYIDVTFHEIILDLVIWLIASIPLSLK
jgi:hypothetical protein